MLYNPEWQRKTAKPVLLKAAALIEEKGHAKYTVQDSNGRVCMYGAVTKAITGDAMVTGDTDIVGFLSLKMGGREDLGVGVICAFNDRHTKEECVAKLKEIANAL